jgi:hypothetical protein
VWSGRKIHFAGTCCLYLQDIYYSILKMEVAGPSEIFSGFYQAARRHILEDSIISLNSNHHETLRSQWNELQVFLEQYYYRVGVCRV